MRKSLDRVNVVDVEATCWDHGTPAGQQSEIIEVGLAVLNVKTGLVEDNDGILVKPQYSTVSPFCTELTTITPELLAEATTFGDACKTLMEKHRGRERVWASYGDYDRNQFDRNCKLYKVKYPFGGRHINVKTLFALKYKLSKEVGMAGALERLGLPLEGTHHRGKDDARNIARILAAILNTPETGKGSNQ